MTTTAFGAPLSTPRRTAAVLRARAAAAGVPAGTVPDDDLAAAVVGAHTWLTVLRLESLDTIPGQPAARALSAIYCRAAGARHGDDAPGTTDRIQALGDYLAGTPAGHLPQALLSQLGPVLHWSAQVSDGDLAVLAAAEDLAAGAGHPLLAAASEALLNTLTIPTP